MAVRKLYGMMWRASLRCEALPSCPTKPAFVRFLEYNFIGKVGQLGYNDAKVANIGSMLDAKAVGVPVLEI